MKTPKLLFLSICSFLGVSVITGSVFAKWSVTDNADPFSMQITLTDDVNVVFKNVDGSTYYSELLTKGDTLATPPSNPTLAGYVFDGWTTDTSTYDESDDVIASKQYLASTTYYPRFASYGYKVGDGSVQHLGNERDSGHVALASAASLSVGTFIYNKSTLENATSPVTIPNAGNYAIYCGTSGSSWDATKAGTFSNWSVERYITATRVGAWTGKNTYMRSYFSDNSYGDYIMQQESGETYFGYVKYNATQIEFGAIYADSGTQNAVEANYANIQYRTDKITLDNTVHYNIPDVAFYLAGVNDSWGVDVNYALTQDTTDTNKYTISNVEFAAGEKIKVRDNANNWFNNDHDWTDCGFTIDTGGNIVITKAGIYNVDFYLTSGDGNHIVPNAVSLYTTINLTYEGSETVYVACENDDWAFHAMTKDGSSYTYTALMSCSDATEFRYVLDDGSTGDWDTLNPTGNRTFTPGVTYGYTYEPPAANTRTIAVYNKFDNATSWWTSSGATWAVQAYTSSESDGAFYPATLKATYNGNEHYLEVVVADTVTKLRVLRCDPAKVSSGSAPSSMDDVWNATAWFDVTANTYLNTNTYNNTK